MNTTFLRLELRRFFRNYSAVFFVAVLPAFFYLVFGAAASYGEESVGRGNVTMYVMVSMAAYGAVTATAGLGGNAALERMQGWGRQLGLTPMTDRSFVLVKGLLAVLVAAVPISLTFALGALTGAAGDPVAWVLSGTAVLLGAWVFSLYGLSIGLALRSEAAVGAASGGLVVLAFLGNIFLPLTGTLLAIAKLTPLYGYVALARYPLTGGDLIDARGTVIDVEPLWVPLLNVGAWAVVFGLLATWLVRRGRARP